jgi:SAM-dependent methyltransferase
MTIDASIKTKIQEQAQGAAALSIAFVGVAKGLFDALAAEALSPADLAKKAAIDPGYAAAWCDAAFAFGYLDEDGPRLSLTPHGRAFSRAEPDSLFGAPVGAVLGAHMAERAAFHSATGARPGEQVLAERESILPLFGPMLERNFGPIFANEILAKVPVFAELDERHGTAVDLGCGNGWYLRALARRFPHLRGVGLDGFEENIAQARRIAAAEGLSDRLDFHAGDLRHFTVDEPVDLIAMNRALHHVWEGGQREVFEILRDHLRPGGAAVIWEPAWPATRADLRSPPFRMMAVQNLSEHVQGNHFLRPAEIVRAFEDVGMSASTYVLGGGGSEAVVVGRKA